MNAGLQPDFLSLSDPCLLAPHRCSPCWILCSRRAADPAPCHPYRLLTSVSAHAASRLCNLDRTKQARHADVFTAWDCSKRGSTTANRGTAEPTSAPQNPQSNAGGSGQGRHYIICVFTICLFQPAAGQASRDAQMLQCSSAAGAARPIKPASRCFCPIRYLFAPKLPQTLVLHPSRIHRRPKLTQTSNAQWSPSPPPPFGLPAAQASHIVLQKGFTLLRRCGKA